MFPLIVMLQVKEPAEVPAVAAALARMRPLCLAEPGCLLWEAYHSQADASLFVLVEHWQSRGHWEAHGQLAAIQTIYLPDVLPRVTRMVHPSILLGV
ncbi:antibiotic biosynthesis monooxygenase family protein [Chromobacterium amazonense]|uniref:Antibiotic biosynthesis monooxygenase family protein n=1 Tax=Chromobacterium amazonense TaxID=1382803 RepID=A0ABU8V165_9NEIS|nr:antibiotic biosynthesis monooxygenase family protein [Chromobacterium amazonense]MDQ4541704.1 antibiotic biosynthesis monooxygenase family protein [Chromobacterium amazonense]